MQPLLQHHRQRKLSATQIGLGTGGQGVGVAVYSASRWVSLKAQHFLLFYRIQASFFPASPKNSLFLQEGLDKKGAHLSCKPATRPRFRTLPFASLCYVVSTGCATQGCCCMLLSGPTPPSWTDAASGCLPGPPQPSLTTSGMHQQQSAINSSLPRSVLPDSTDRHPRTILVHPLGVCVNYLPCDHGQVK